MEASESSKTTTSALIAGIEIRKLFGRYDYDLRIPSDESRGFSKISMMYGDNGTGKTTILKMLFHLLSPARAQGHKTFIARVPFSLFSVTFSDGTKIDVVRNQPNLTGPFTISLSKASGYLLDAKFEVDEQGFVPFPSGTPEVEQMLTELSKLGLSIYFLGDDRRLQSDEFRDEEELEKASIGEVVLDRSTRHLVPRRSRQAAFLTREAALRQSLERTNDWLRRRSMKASSRGEAEAQHIYASIIETINKLGVPHAEDYETQRKALVQDLKSLDERSRTFTEFGLISKIDTRRFDKGLKGAGEEGLPSVAQVVRSFIDGQKARLDALEELNTLLHRFVTLINNFLLHKGIQLDVREGISILSDSEAPISSDDLSSGEKQLLLLLCNVLMSSESASLFLIDEPEISLNVKWQRRLVDALIEITSGSQCQFILATHSIELLSKHNNCVMKLRPR